MFSDRSHSRSHPDHRPDGSAAGSSVPAAVASAAPVAAAGSVPAAGADSGSGDLPFCAPFLRTRQKSEKILLCVRRKTVSEFRIFEP